MNTLTECMVCGTCPYYHSTTHNMYWILFIFRTAIGLSKNMKAIDYGISMIIFKDSVALWNFANSDWLVFWGSSLIMASLFLFHWVYHDDVMKWKHFPRYWPFARGIHRSTVNSPHKGQWRVALMFSLIYAWIRGWVNNREAGDLRRHQVHYGVIVMI